MYKVLLVDDEALIREAISENTRWKELGYELMGTCKNGREAMEHLSEIATVVYLELDLANLKKRLGNLKNRGVVLRDGQTLDDLFNERVPLYEKYADVVVNESNINVEETVQLTLEKIKEMDPEIANTLKPVIPSASNLKWADVFKSVSITADDDIPINKRGSGVKRLILLNFFRAEAERRMSLCDGTGVIYATH